MKKLLVLVLIFSYVLTAGICQISSSLKLDSFLHQQVILKDSFEAYYDNLKVMESWCLKNGYTDQIKKNSKSFALLLPKNTEDSLLYRKATMYHASKLKKATGNINDALKFYLISHAHGSSVNYSDKWSWYIENPIGNIYARLSNYEKAIYFYHLSAKSPSGKKKLGRIYKNISSSYFWLGDTLRAKNYLKKTLEVATKANDNNAIHSGYEQLASINLEEGDMISFHKNYLRSLEAIDKIDEEYERSRRKANLYNLKANYHQREKEYSQADSYYRKAIYNYDKISTTSTVREIAKQYHKIAEAYLEQGKFNQCNSALDSSFAYLIPEWDSNNPMPKKEEVYGENTFIDILKTKAAYYYRRELKSTVTDIDSALMACDLALEVNDNLASTILIQNSKFLSISDNRKILNNAVEYAYSGYKKTSRKTYLVKLEKYFRKSKGTYLKERIQLNKIKNQVSDHDMKMIIHLENKVIEHYSSSSTKESDQLSLQKNIESLYKIYYQANILSQEYEALSRPYLEYLVADKDIFILTNIGDERVLKLSTTKQKLNKYFLELNSKIANKDSKDLDSILNRLYEILIPVDLSEVGSITFIPDDFLSSLSFDVLKRQEKYLIEQLPISYAYQNIQETTTVESIKKPIKLFALFPNYKSLDNFSTTRGDLSYLTYASQEKKGLMNIPSITTRIDTIAEASELKDKISASDIFHFGGHAIAEKANSYLATVTDEGNDEKISNKQIEFLDSDLELVVLSACKTGVGELVFGEGIRSLASSFLAGGSKAVLYSLWNINDKSTSELMIPFYTSIVEGKSKSQSLRIAKLKYLKNASPENKHPYYWSGLSIIGDPSAIYNSSAISFEIIYIIPILIMLIYLTQKSKHDKSENAS